MKKPNCLRFLLFIAHTFLWLVNVQAQPVTTREKDTTRFAYTDISKINLSANISRKVVASFIDPQVSLPENYSLLVLNDTIRKGFVSKNDVTKKAVIRFSICNTGDTVRSVWFFPGFYFRNIQLYKLEENNLKKLPSILPKDADSISYRKISVAEHDSVTIVAEMTLARTYLNALRPRLINTDYLPTFLADWQTSKEQSNLITYVFCGLLLMMILYSLANFFQGANREFLYYSGYAFFLGLMLFLKAMYSLHSTKFSFFQEEFLDYIMQDTGILFYMIFMQKYLDTKTQHPFLHQFYNAGILLLIISMTSFTGFHYLTDNFVLENLVENITKLLLLAMVLIFLIYSLSQWKDKLLRYLFWGNLCLFVFSLLSQMTVMFDFITKQLPGIFGSSLFYYEVGLFLELVFFLGGLNHKNRKQLIAQARETERLKADNLMKEYEKELAVFKAQQQERERISADMHDELGSGMTAIRLMSEIARNKMKQETPVEIEKISQSADEVLNKMNAIIWSMNSGNDTVDNLVSYIRSYSLEYFESTPVHCKVNTPENIQNRELTGDKRRNIFLCIKETLNNALKHSKASEIRIDFKINQSLQIKISDNGIGIDLKNLRLFGNGLKNIARRMDSIGGTYEIENNHGTVTILTLPLD